MSLAIYGSVRTQEILSYASYNQPRYHIDNGGMWRAPCDHSLEDLFAAGTTAGWGARGVARRGLALRLDQVIVNVEFAEAPEDFSLPMGGISRGPLAGYRFEVVGLIDDRPVVAVEHVTEIIMGPAPTGPDSNRAAFA